MTFLVLALASLAIVVSAVILARSRERHSHEHLSVYDDCALLSEGALADWSRPAEDAAWGLLATGGMVRMIGAHDLYLLETLVVVIYSCWAPRPPCAISSPSGGTVPEDWTSRRRGRL